MAKISFENVVFDFDSTLASVEGLDAIARKKGKLGVVKKITSAWMNGGLPFSRSIRLRLKLIKPTVDDFLWLREEYRKNLLSDAQVVIEKIQKSGARVHIVSGGPRLAVEPIARFLEVEPENIWASCLIVGNGKFFEADNNCLMTGDRGKIEIVKRICPTGRTVVIGDGMTNYEAGKSADLFIGFGGIVKRDEVKELSRVYIEEQRLSEILQYLK